MLFSAYYITHAAAAIVFAGLVVWMLVRGVKSSPQRLLLAAFSLTGIWAWLSAANASMMLTGLAETARNLAFIGLLHHLAMNAINEQRQKGLKLVYGAVAAVLGTTVMAQLAIQFAASLDLDEGPMFETLAILRMTAAAGGLVLVHNLYGQSAPGSRGALRTLMTGLAVMWVYDLNLYTLMYMKTGIAQTAWQWRGLSLVVAAPFFFLGGHLDAQLKVRLSRAATFQSLSLLGICAYFSVMAILATVLQTSVGQWVGALAATLLSILTVAAMVIMPSARARSWAKVKIAKHFFEHRYDYRSEWLRFTELVGGDAADSGPLGQRISRAFADLLDAPGGVLFVEDTPDGLRVAADWQWPGIPADPPARALATDFWEHVAGEARILELKGLREGWGDAADRDAGPPDWLVEFEHGWIAIPLLHQKRLVGLVILAEPEFRRALDWEDFDLLRTAGSQAAAALAEAVGQQELARAQRFEEFNRRFAFIMHDIKNVVSQLSLLSRNAERHADNPEFRTDMVATLKGSVDKMNDLLARLAPQGGKRDARAEPVPVDDIVSFAVAAKRRDHDIRLEGARGIWAIADATALEEAVNHLVQNAIDASPKDAPVHVRVTGDDSVTITIRDHGSGMDADFIRNRLFEPFASTKDGGFGIGAFEARALVMGMGGRLDVASRKGEGSTFTISLSPAEAPATRKTA